MTRYVERAGNLARLIDVNRQQLLDSERIDSERLLERWRPVLACTGDDVLFDATHEEPTSRAVVHFLTNDARNPNSILSCIGQARENARTIRDQLSDELWEELNSLYIFMKSPEAARLLQTDPPGYYEKVRRGGETFLGTAASTVARDEAWEFMDIGRHLERADKITRILDIASYLPGGPDGEKAGPLHWSAVLRSCGAMGAFRAKHGNRVRSDSVTEYLLFSMEFPRSVRFCIDRVDACLHKISRSPRGAFCNDAERETGQLLAGLNYGNIQDVETHGLHAYLDDLQGKINRIGEALFETYVLMPDHIASDSGPEPANSALSASSQWQIQQ